MLPQSPYSHAPSWTTHMRQGTGKHTHTHKCFVCIKIYVSVIFLLEEGQKQMPLPLKTSCHHRRCWYPPRASFAPLKSVKKYVWLSCITGDICRVTISFLFFFSGAVAMPLVVAVVGLLTTPGGRHFLQLPQLLLRHWEKIVLIYIKKNQRKGHRCYWKVSFVVQRTFSC